MKLTRRSVLQSGAGAAALGTLAGCLSGPEDGGNPEGGYASFFAVWDMAQEIAGDEIEFENAVPTDEMGHGWEPPGDLQREIADSDVFVYLDTDEFPWAQDYVADFERDYDHLTLIDGMAAVEDQLLPVDRDSEADRDPSDHDFDPDSLRVTEFELYHSRSGELIAWWHGNHWHGNVPDLLPDDRLEIEFVAEDDEGRVLPLGDDEQFQVRTESVDGGEGEVVDIDATGDAVEFQGLETGRTRVVFELVADGEVVFDTRDDNLGLEVVDELADDEDLELYDPHVWIDPVLVQDIVEEIRDSLIEADPDNEDLYEENAAEYVDRVQDVHEELQSIFDETDQEIAVLAGHDAFQYLEVRYGFELHTPLSISPDDFESSSDIGDMIEVVEDNDIDTILYDPFDDTSEMIDAILEETDATETAKLSPLEGTFEEWDEEGYGWVEQMEEVNIPSLRKAFDVE